MSECLSNSIKTVRIYSYEDIRNAVLKSYMDRSDLSASLLKKNRIIKARAIYVSKLDRIFSLLASYMGACARLPRLASMHPFYSEIAVIASGGKYEELLDRCKRAIHLITKLYREYRKRIIESEDPSEIKKLAREYVGRSLSIIRRGLKGVEILRNAINEISKSPCISSDMANVVICGMPQVGKSTLVSRISTAKPETSPFPFTTKRVIMGHIDLGGRRVSIIDTPGILDRPIEEMNEIELKAVSAIKHLADIAVFLIDPRRGAYYSLEQQLRVLDSVEKIIRKEKILIAINKIDILSKEEIELCISRLRERGYENIYMISALKGEGIDDLVKGIIKKLEYSNQQPPGSSG
ncbi:MAG: GTPase [Sulfolobales archaeon]